MTDWNQVAERVSGGSISCIGTSGKLLGNLITTATSVLCLRSCGVKSFPPKQGYKWYSCFGEDEQS
jgi:hypothetical protein